MADPHPVSPATLSASSASKAAPRPVASRSSGRPTNFSGVPFWVGLGLSFVWVAGVVALLVDAGSAQSMGGIPLTNLALGVSAVAAPVALIWMVTAYLQRAADVQSVAEPLRRQLLMITGESGIAEQRLRRFNQAVREQLDLLRHAQALSHEDLAAVMEGVRRAQEDMQHFEQRSAQQTEAMQAIVRKSIHHLEQMMEDKFVLMRVLDGKLTQTGEEAFQQAAAMRQQIGDLLDAMTATASGVREAVDHARHDSQKLSEEARSQETTLREAAARMSGVVQDLSGGLQQTMDRFLDKAGAARKEAERLSQAIDLQTRSLEEFSGSMPARVGEAESVLRGVAERLYASEQLARDQAVTLGATLGDQAEGFKRLFDRFGAQVQSVDGAFQRRQSDLDALLIRFGAATEDAARALDGATLGLKDRTQAALQNFTTASDEARAKAEAVGTQLATTVASYEESTRALNEAAQSHETRWRDFSEEVRARHAQFAILAETTSRAGSEIQTATGAALQNLQQVLDRLSAARETAQSVGESLAGQILQAVHQNEQAIARLNEAGRMTVHALGASVDALGRKEGDLKLSADGAEQALRQAMVHLQASVSASEEALRSRNAELIALLEAARGQLASTEGRMADFVAQASSPFNEAIQNIERLATAGLGTLDGYGTNMREQFVGLQGMHAQVEIMGTKAEALASSTLAALETLQNKFAVLRAAQDETAQAALGSLDGVAGRLRAEVDLLGDRAADATMLIADATSRFSDSARQIRTDSEESSKQVGVATTTLIEAEQKWGTLEERLSERARTTESALDRVLARCHQAIESVAATLDQHGVRLEKITDAAEIKSGDVNAALDRQLGALSAGVDRMAHEANRVGEVGGGVLQVLSTLNEKLLVTQESTVQRVRQSVASLTEAGQTFAQQGDILASSAHQAAHEVQQARTDIATQAESLAETSRRVGEDMVALQEAASACAERTSGIRAGIRNESRLMTGELTSVVQRLESSAGTFDQTLAGVLRGAHQASARFTAMTEEALVQVEGSAQRLLDVAAKTENSLDSLGTGLGRQTAGLNLVGEQLGEQNRTLVAQNEERRASLVELFDNISALHHQTSELADTSLGRLGETLRAAQAHLGAVEEQTKGAVVSVREAGGAFADQATLLLQNAQEAEQQARTVLVVTSALQDQARQIREALQGEGERTNGLFGGMLNKISAGHTELRNISSTAETTLTNLQNILGQQTSGLSAQMQQLTDRQRGLTTSLDAQRDVLNGLLSRLTLAQDETAAIAERTAARLTEGTQQITRQMEAMETQSGATLTAVQTTGALFAEQSSALAGQTQGAEQQVQALALHVTSLQDQARRLREALQDESGRMGENLATFLAKINTGTSEMRNLGLTAEGLLETLNGMVQSQAGLLGSTTRQVGDRQRELLTLLNDQRDALTGLLGRLAAAQDEAVGAAEGRMARLTEGVRVIAKNMETLSTESQNALTGLRTAGSGFSEEAASLGAQTQQAEQNVRGLVAVMTHLQDQAQRTRESLQAESGRVAERIGGILAQLDQAGQKLRDQSASVIQNLDQSVSGVTSLTQTATEALRRQGDALGDVAEQASTHLTVAGAALAEHAQTVASVGEQAEQRAYRLVESSDEAVTRLGNLRRGLLESEQEASAVLERARAHVGDAQTSLTQRMGEVAEGAEESVRRVGEATEGLRRRGEALVGGLTVSEQAVARATSHLREDLLGLPDVLEAGAERIEEAGQSLKADATAAEGHLIATADRFIEVTGLMRNSLMDEVTLLNATSEGASEVFTLFKKGLAEQVDALRGGVVHLADEQDSLVKKTSATLAQLGVAGDRLAHLRTESISAAEKLASEFSTIESRAGGTAARLLEAGAGVSQHVTRLVEAASKGEAQLGEATQGFREQMERVRSGVQGQVDDLNRGLMQLTAQMERTGAALKATTAGAATEVEKTTVRLDQASRDTTTALTERTARLRVAVEEGAELLKGFGQQIEGLLDRLASASQGIKGTEGELASHLHVALANLRGIREGLEAGRVLARNAAEDAVAQLVGVRAELERQVKDVQDGAETVTGLVRKVSEAYTGEAQGLNTVVLGAQEHVLETGQAIGGLQDRAGQLHATLKVQTQDLMFRLEHVLQQLAEAGESPILLGGLLPGEVREESDSRKISG